MKHGGILEESKLGMYQKTPTGIMPQTFRFEPHKIQDCDQFINSIGLSFPLIIKPDRGMRGMGVYLIHSLKQLENIKLKPGFEYIIQEYVNYPKEAGIFCIKNPKTNQWKITSIMEREFLTVEGDGKSTLEELIKKDYRAFLQLPRWKKSQEFDLNQILPKKELKSLVKLGNHRLGTRFNDKMFLLSPPLQKAVISLCNSLEGFEYGRMDIVFESWEKLEQLESFKVIEVNGTNSEPAHIYDPKHSIFYAWKVLFYHWHKVFQISMFHIRNGVKPLTFSEYKTLHKSYSRLMKY